jgi:hypothetical protein
MGHTQAAMSPKIDMVDESILCLNNYIYSLLPYQ